MDEQNSQPIDQQVEQPTPAVTQSTTPPSQPTINKQSYFSKIFTGRLNRRNYSVGVLLFLSIPVLLVLVNLIKTLAFGPSLSPASFTSNASQNPTQIIDTILTVTTIIIFLPALILGVPYSISLQVRRLHDLGQSEWLLLLQFVPLVGLVFPFCVALWPGNSFDNKFGIKPLPRISVKSDILKLN